MIPVILEACPSFRSEWESFLAEWEDSHHDLPLYVTLTDLAVHLIRMLERGETGSCPNIFRVVERWHVEGDGYVREAATVGLLEGLQNLNFHENGTDPEQFRPYLGPISEWWWEEVHRWWHGGEPRSDSPRTGYRH